MERNEGKRGERVRLTKGRPGYDLVAGEEGTLTEDNDGAPFVKFDGHKKNWAIDMNDLELIVPKSDGVKATTTFTISTDKFYRTRNGKVTGRVTVGDTGFEAVADGRVRIYDAAGGAVHGDDDIVEAWVPKVGERVVEAAPKQYDFVAHWRDFWQGAEGPIVEDAFVVTNLSGNFVHYSNRVGGNGPQATIDCFEPLPAAPQPAATLKIEAGKFYRTRDGRKVGPMGICLWGGFYDTARRVTGQRWEANGTFIKGQISNLDLIAEWQDTPAAPIAAQVDAIAEEYGSASASNDNAAKPKFKVGDRVVFRNYSGSEHCYGTVEDVSVDGKHVLASDWSIGAEGGHLPVADLELADTEPDATLNIKFTSDFSELDAAILVRKKKLKKLIKLARKAGIELREAA